MKIVAILLFIIFSFGASAEQYSMRDCMLLPITDTAGNSHGYKIFEELENSLKRKKWCTYIPSSEIISVFSKYREGLSEHLQDSNVIRTVANRLRVGTLIRVALQYEVDKVKVKMDIIGENGEDLYLSEQIVFDEINHNQIMTALNNWLEIYETTIPYDGKVLGVLGDQLTFSLPKNKILQISQPFNITRLMGTKSHPLLKKVVEWNKIKMAKGKIYNISRNQALGVVKVYTTERKVEVGDWVTIGKLAKSKMTNGKLLSKYGKKNFGRLGEVSLALGLSSTTLASKSAAGSMKYGGFTYGIDIQTDVWMTRQYFLVGQFSKRLGKLTSSSGSPSQDSTGITTGVFKVGAGYKYLPMGFFYGPQIDVYGGWVNYGYVVDASDADGVGSYDVSGIFLGLKGNIPVKKGLRAFGRAEVLPFADAEDGDDIYGSVKSVSSIVFEVGGKYQYAPGIVLNGSFEMLSNSAKFSGSNSQISTSDSIIKAGGSFTF